MSTKLVLTNSNFKLATQVAEKLGCEIIPANTQRFADQELKIAIKGDILGANVLILQSLSNPVNDNLMELMFLADFVKRSGGVTIMAIIPYFGYSRNEAGAALIANLLTTAGVDQIITIDLHSKQGATNIKNLSPIPLFIPFLKKKYVVVSPDTGSIPRSKTLAEVIHSDLVIMRKVRNAGECIILEMLGDVFNRDCIIVDDIVDTGDTLCQAALFLRNKGAKSISACVTHGVFSGDCLKKIEDIGLLEFYITDSINHHQLPSFINIVSTADLIASRCCFRKHEYLS